MLEQLKRRDPVLADRKVLIVDDDVRNIFALTSALESYNMKVVHAENGQKAIDLLKATPGIEAVLMDIMMPEMDGYEAISEIRKMDNFRSLPIIALTAKAMKADRDHCLEVGASDYISKPLDIDQLFSLLRVWLSRKDDDS
jgi:CheY-like chemotaxis protein